MIETQVEHISSTHSFGMHRFSLIEDSCKGQSVLAEDVVGNLKQLFKLLEMNKSHAHLYSSVQFITGSCTTYITCTEHCNLCFDNKAKIKS